MRVLKYKHRIEANIDHVFDCHRDWDFACKYINELSGINGIRARQDGDVLQFVDSNKLALAKVIESAKPSFLKIEVTPVSEKLEWYGTIFANCVFIENGNITTVTVEFISNKNPGMIWKVVIKFMAIILNFRSRKYEKSFTQAIENSAQHALADRPGLP